MFRRRAHWAAVLTILLAGSAFGVGQESEERLAENGELVFLTWSEYMEPELLEEFEEKFHVRVRQVFFEADDDRDDLMAERDGRGYDLVLINGIQVEPYVRRGWLAPLTTADIPNLRHIDPRWREAYAHTADYAVPYAWGTVGVAYRRDLVPEPVTSWMQFFRPPESSRGRIAMVKNARDCIGSALKALGYSSNSTDSRELEAAERLLLEQKPYVKSYTYISLSEKSGLVTGDLVAAIAYNGDGLMLKEHEPKIEFLVPHEGGTLWVDYVVVTQASQKKKLAMEFVNFLSEPKNAARTAEFLYYATPNTEAEKLLPKEFLSDPIIYPPKEVLAKSEFEGKLPPRVMKKRNTIFARVLQ